MLQCSFQKYVLQFITPGGTSRGVMHEKETWIITLTDSDDPLKVAYGECGIFKGLSFDDKPEYELTLSSVCKAIPEKGKSVLENLEKWPSIHFGVEMLLKDWENGANHILFDTDFAKGNEAIDINGLIWMGNKDWMAKQIKQKLREGYRCLKMKIGNIDFETELEILASIRKQFNAEVVELRVDANGAFLPKEALSKLTQLSKWGIHSIEQPIKAGQVEEMASLVEKSPIPIALDEELIGITSTVEKRKLLKTINPPYIILKPSLCGGFSGSNEWIKLIGQQGGRWWLTSALESNIGLNAIAQFASSKKNSLPQGLGTGRLFSNNVESPLFVQCGKLFFDKDKKWNFENLKHD